MAKSLNGQNFVPSKPKKTTSGEWITFKTVPWTQEVSWTRKTLILFPMIKTLIASGVAVSAAALASPALADVYVNPEFNGGSYGD